MLKGLIVKVGNLNDLWYESHAAIVRRVCMELNQSEKTNELLEKLLGQKLKMKAQKDPNKPKRSKTAFLHFCDAKRVNLMKKMKKDNKKVNVGELAKKMGQLWKALNPKDKEKYQKLAETDKEEYVKKLAEYNESLEM